MCSNSKITLLGKHKKDNKWILCESDCMTWQCPECAEKRVKLHQLRIIEACGVTLGGRWTFVTITASEHSRGFEKSLINLKQGWTKLAERLRRKFGTRHYVLMHERHSDSTLHIHMLYNAHLTKKWLKTACRACLMGYKADSQLLRDSKSAGKYVTKYLTKAVSDGDAFPKRFKRVRYSVGFPQFQFKNDQSEYLWRAYATYTHEDHKAVRYMARQEKAELIDHRNMIDNTDNTL